MPIGALDVSCDFLVTQKKCCCSMRILIFATYTDPISQLFSNGGNMANHFEHILPNTRGRKIHPCIFFHWNFLSCYRVWNFYWCTYKRDKYLWEKNCAQFKVFSEMWWWFHGHPSLKLHHILLNKKYRNTQSFFHECRMWRAGIFGPHCCLKPLF